MTAADALRGATDDPLLAVDDLAVRFTTSGGVAVDAVGGLSLRLARSRCLAIVGESGSGKSATARALVGLAGGNARVTADRLEFAGEDLRALDARGWRAVRGRRIGFVLQDALNSMDPFRRIDREVAESALIHGLVERAGASERAAELLERSGVPDPALRAQQYPHELSGGLRQRALIASALSAAPELIIADEPTTALDVTVQQQIMRLLDELKQAGTALIVISHDLAVVARIADEVIVMRHGRVVETGPVARLFGDPQHPYTQSLVAATPRVDRGVRVPRPAAPVTSDGAAAPPLLTAHRLHKSFRGPHGTGRQAVVDVSFDVRAGETLSVVGESGSGKSTLARLLLALAAPDAGEVLLDGEPWSTVSERRRRHRRWLIQPVHQNPLDSIDPRLEVGDAVAEGLGRELSRAQRRVRVAELLDAVGLDPDLAERRPVELSGGQLQRVTIARALAPGPRLLICDEPVSALDVTVQAQVLALFRSLQDRLGLALVFISHDLGVVQQLSHRVAVMKDGRVVEHGDVADVYRAPQHPYTARLLDAADLGARPALPDPHPTHPTTDRAQPTKL